MLAPIHAPGVDVPACFRQLAIGNDQLVDAIRKMGFVIDLLLLVVLGLEAEATLLVPPDCNGHSLSIL